MKPPSKTLVIVMIVVILAFVAIQAILPDRQVTEEKANLIVVSGTDVPIGSIGVNYNRWNGTLNSEGVQNADGSMMRRGDKVCFAVESWPAVVMVYGDLQGSEVLATLIIETAPEDGSWTATVRDGGSGLNIFLD